MIENHQISEDKSTGYIKILISMHFVFKGADKDIFSRWSATPWVKSTKMADRVWFGSCRAGGKTETDNYIKKVMSSIQS